MTTQELTDRINVLSQKSKEEGLTEAEQIEQKKLREKYIKLFKNNLESQLKSIKIKQKEF